MKLYTFLDKDDKIIEQVRAENHDEAVIKSTVKGINSDTDFYRDTTK